MRSRMAPVWVAAIVLVLAASAPAAAAAPRNLFANPGFESGREGWRVDKAPGTEAGFAVDDALAADGRHSALVTVEKVGEWGVQFGQSFDAGRKGKTYTFAVVARAVGAPVAVQLEIERQADPYDRAVCTEPVTLTPDTWTELHATFTVEKDFPQGWFAYVSCVQAGARFRVDLFRLTEGPYVPYKEAGGEALAAAGVRVYDTGAASPAPLASVALAGRAGWVELAEGETAHAFTGDAVATNGVVAVVARRGAPGVELHAAGPAGWAHRATLAPAVAAASGAASRAEAGAGAAAADAAAAAMKLVSVKVAQVAPAGAAVDVAFETSAGQRRTIALRLAPGQTFVETAPRDGAAALAVAAPCRFAVLPDFFADDIVLDAASLPVDKVELPAEHFLLHLLDGGDAIVMAVWNARDLDASGTLAGAGDARRFAQTEVPYGKDGKAWVAVLTGTGIWHRHDVARGDAGKIVRLDWRPPFAAQWRVDWRRTDGLADSWEMAVERSDGRFDKPGLLGGDAVTLPANRRRWTTVLGTFAYPCWIDKSGAGRFQPLKKGLPVEGPALIYPVGRVRETPLEAFTVVDLVRATLGVGPCEYILDVEGQRSEYRGRATCSNRDFLEEVYGRGEQKRRRAEVERSLEEVMVFIRHIRSRIETYVEFGRWAREYLARQKAAHPELAGPLADLEALARAVDERVAARREAIRTPDEAQEMVAAFRATVLDYTGPGALEKCKTFTRAWVEIGENQDELVGECRWAVKVLRQRAGLMMAADPRLAETADELRSRAQKVLRNPASHEGARH